MSKLLLAIAVFCFISMVSADMVSLNLYNTHDCTGSVVYQQNYTIGECKEQSAYYVTGTNIYSISFDGDNSCGSANATSQTQYTAGACYNGVTFTNMGATPAYPSAISTSSWTTSTSYYNATSGRRTKDCTGTVTAVSATAPVTCVKLGGGFWASGGCSTSATYNTWYVTYTDAACTNQVSVKQFNAVYGQCVDGTSGNTCSGSGSASINSALTLSFEANDYDNTCTFNSTTTTKTWAAPSTCFGNGYSSMSAVCSAVNGTTTQTFNVNIYNSKDCSGTATTYPFPDSTVTKNCVNTDSTLGQSWGQFKCTDGGNSASTAAVSTLVMMVAALLAMVSVRSL